MILHVKIGTMSMQVVSTRLRKPPKIGAVFEIQIGDPRRETVRLDQIKDMPEGFKLYYVSRW